MKLDSDDFELFGLARRFHLDRADLDERWRALQGQTHPDKFAAEGAAAKRIALQWAVRVNEAYQRLKDPLRRAAYLCELAGHPIAAETNTAMPAAFLVRQMELRESLDEARSPQDIAALAQDIAAQRQAAAQRLQHLLDVAQDTASAAQEVRALMFLERFAADIEHRLAALEQ
ncbi:MAG: Fe-S protein assembly co-chaperone HscB [Burkholderiaceae bacterium]